MNFLCDLDLHEFLDHDILNDGPVLKTIKSCIVCFQLIGNKFLACNLIYFEKSMFKCDRPLVFSDIWATANLIPSGQQNSGFSWNWSILEIDLTSCTNTEKGEVLMES